MGKIKTFKRIFDFRNENFNEINNELNKLFIINLTKHFEKLLYEREYVFLNEVYEYVGFEKSKEGQLYGWSKREGDLLVNIMYKYDVLTSSFYILFQCKEILDILPSENEI